MFSHRLFVYPLTILCMALAEYNQTWRLAWVEQAVLATLYNVTEKASTEIACFSLASMYEWPHLACYNAGTCIMYQYDTYPKEDASAMTAPVECKTSIPPNTKDCVLGNGTIIPEGTTWIDSVCHYLICEGMKIVNYQPKFARRCFLEGYVRVNGLGCVKLFQNQVNWCTARATCFLDGADLVSLADDSEFPILTNFLKSKGVAYHTWLGLHRTEGTVFHWTLGGPNISSVVGSWFWRAGNPDNTIMWRCASARKTSFAEVEARDCAEQKIFLCEIPNA